MLIKLLPEQRKVPETHFRLLRHQQGRFNFKVGIQKHHKAMRHRIIQGQINRHHHRRRGHKQGRQNRLPGIPAKHEKKVTLLSDNKKPIFRICNLFISNT